MTPRWAQIGGTVSMVGFTPIVTALTIFGLAGMMS